MIKEYLKKIKNNGIKDILKGKSSKKIFYTVPYDLDKKIKINLKKISEEIKLKKKKYSLLFTPRLAFCYSMIALVIIGAFLFFYSKFNILISIKNIFIENPIVEIVNGNVYIKKEKDNNWIKLEVGKKICETTFLKTEKKSEVTINCSNNTFLFIKENSIVNFKKINRKLNKKTDNSIELLQGKLLVNINKYLKDSQFKILVKNIIYTARGTKFIVLYNKYNDYSKLIVNEGIVGVNQKIDFKYNMNNIRKKSKKVADNLDRFIQDEYLVKKNRELTIKHGDLADNEYKINNIISEIESILSIDNIENKNKINNINNEIENLRIKKRKEIEKNIKINNIDLEGKNIKLNENKNITELYKNDFEINSKEIYSNNEWGIVDNDNNHVFAPLDADVNSDSFLNIKETENFSIQFRFKRFPNKYKKCWMAIDLGIDSNKYSDKENDWIIIENKIIIFGNRLKYKEYITANYNFKFNKWYVFKIIVKEGKEYSIYIDNNKIISYKKEDKVKYNYIKFEGNPILGKWYLDDIYFECKQFLSTPQIKFFTNFVVAVKTK